MAKSWGLPAKGRSEEHTSELQSPKVISYAVFLGIGLGHSPAMGIPGEELIIDGLDYIEQSKLNLAGMKIGRNVVVIGAGNTAIDCATIAKRLGAGRVTLAYRRTEEEMRAYPHEIEFIRKEGVEFRFEMTPESVVIEDGKVMGLACQGEIGRAHV